MKKFKVKTWKPEWHNPSPPPSHPTPNDIVILKGAQINRLINNQTLKQTDINQTFLNERHTLESTY